MYLFELLLNTLTQLYAAPPTLQAETSWVNQGKDLVFEKAKKKSTLIYFQHISLIVWEYPWQYRNSRIICLQDSEEWIWGTREGSLARQSALGCDHPWKSYRGVATDEKSSRGVTNGFLVFFFFLKKSVKWWKQSLRTGRCWAWLSCIKRRIRYSWRQWKIRVRQIPGWIPVLRYFSICVPLGNFIWAQFCYLWNRENYNCFVVLLWELNMIVHWKHYIHMRYSKKFSCLPSCHLCWEAVTTT